MGTPRQTLLPEFLRLWNIVKSDNPDLDLTALYLAFSVVFVVFGGILTIAFDPENRWKALWVGASFPALVSTLIAQAPTIAS